MEIHYTSVLESAENDKTMSAPPSALNPSQTTMAQNLRRADGPATTTNGRATGTASTLNGGTPVQRSSTTTTPMHNGPIMSNKSASSLLQLPPQPVNVQTEQQRLAGRIFTDAVTTPQWPTSNVTFDPADVRRMSQSVPPNSAHPTTTQAVDVPKRVLPPRDVTEQTIEEAYIAFILYCNPTIPAPKDLTDLGRMFRTPPKSDGKAFSTYRLFELIRQLESKEIKSWSQLALSLGVDPPDRNQSSQKVQQYAVRLKRWMHAMHLDAFFAYCSGKPHTYYTSIPMAEDAQMENRDGVPREEDLALRALQPEKRTKRGRRKVEKEDGEDEGPLSANKRARLGTPSDTGDFDSFTHDTAGLYSTTTVAPPGQEEDIDRYTKQLDTWPETGPMSTTTTGPQIHASNVFAQSPTNRANSGNFGAQQFRWRLNAAENNNNNASTPASLYPQSAITPTAPHLPDNVFAEPMSAITPASAITGGVRGRGRRRHGPAVSSAWPSAGSSTSSGKFRGRPPSNRSVRDGPFSTFPANPKTRTGPLIDVQQQQRGGSQLSTPVTGGPSGGGAERWTSQLTQSNPTESTPTSALVPKPMKRASLQLQVPERKGEPVRLATPTTMRSINGINATTNNHHHKISRTQDTTATLMNHSDDNAGGGGAGSDSELFVSSHHAEAGTTASPTAGFFPVLTHDDVIESLAARFVQASFFGDIQLDPSTAQSLAKQLLENLRYGYKTEVDEARFLMDVALWFGLGDDLELGCVSRSYASEIRLTRVPTTINGPNAGIVDAGADEDEDEGFGRLTTLHSGHHDGDGDEDQAQRYVIAWKVSLGLLSGNFSMPVTLPPRLEGHGGRGHGLDGHSDHDGTTTTTNHDAGRNVKHASEDEDGHMQGHRTGNGSGNGEEQSWKMKYLKLLQQYAEERARTRQAIVAALF